MNKNLTPIPNTKYQILNTYHIILALFLITFTLSFAQVIHAQSTNDVTSKIENIGNPTRARWPDNNVLRYSRNVWDMQTFNNRIYIGSGDMDANTGPIDILYYDPVSSTFKKDQTTGTNYQCGAGCVDDEQIERFRLLNNQLYIPGYDAREDWQFGNFYRLEQNGWVKYRNIPEGLHVDDFDIFNNQLFVAMSHNATVDASILISSDGGLTWTKTNQTTLLGATTFFQVGGKLYDTTGFGVALNTGPAIYEYQGGTSFNPRTDLTFAKVFPNTSTTNLFTALLVRPVNFKGKLVYLGLGSFNDVSRNNIGIYSTSNMLDAVKINLPNNARPEDVRVSDDGNTLYALGSIKNGSRYWVTVSSTTDLLNWTEVLRFDAATFARSFEQSGGDWYFGLGTDSTTSPSTATGDILRYKISLPSPPASTKPGDIDSDNDVDIFDYNILLTNFGKTQSGVLGDIDNNGRVDIFDYNILLTNFGK